MRVMAVVDSTSGGGAETSLAAMAPHLIESGIDLQVAYFHDREGVKEQLEAAGATLFHVPPGRNRLVTISRLRKLIRSQRPDLVHTMVYEADIAGRTAAFLSRTPVVSSIINEMYGPEHRATVESALGFRLAWLTDAATAKLVRRFHAITETVADVMAPRLHVDRALIDVVYRGRDPEAFRARTPARRMEIRKSLGIDGEFPILLATSRQEPQKGLDMFIEALPTVLAERPGATVLLAGREGASTADLKRRTEDLGLVDHVQFLGHRRDIAELLCAADALVFPSWFEGLGGSLVEAMAVGCPIVCTDLPVLREVTQLEGGGHAAQFFPPGDANALAGAVLRTLDRQGDHDLTKRSRMRFESAYQILAVSKEMHNFYLRALHRLPEVASSPCDRHRFPQ
jgi:glycosyltransferase involved in cell wall biosynthesis